MTTQGWSSSLVMSHGTLIHQQPHTHLYLEQELVAIQIRPLSVLPAAVLLQQNKGLPPPK